MTDRQKAFLKKMTKVGTPECAIFCGAAALVFMLLVFAFGFWQTLLLALIVALGAFVGGVQDKKTWLRNTVNKLFPPKNDKPYKAEDARVNRQSRPDEAAAGQESAASAETTEGTPAEHTEE